MKPVGNRGACGIALLLGIAVLTIAVLGTGAPTRAEEAVAPLAARLAGKTLSAVVYASDAPGPVTGRSLHRIVLQAYLEADGRAIVRQWQASRDAYTPPFSTRWSLSGDDLCIDLPARPLCARVHVWGPRIAGIGINPYAMLDGDLRPGDAIGARR